MSKSNDLLLKKVSLFLNTDAKNIESMEQLSFLPCESIKEISATDSEKLRIQMNISMIKELAEIDLQMNEAEISQAGFDLFSFEKWVIAARIITTMESGR